MFPNTLQIDITERTITAVVEVPNENAQNSTQWAIASDGMWLMPIPDRDSEAGRRTNSKVYEDAESVLHITDVPYGTKPAVGSYCTDANVNNALAIVAGMTTELADRVTSVKATETASTTLTIKDGPDIVFGARVPADHEGASRGRHVHQRAHARQAHVAFFVTSSGPCVQACGPL